MHWPTNNTPSILNCRYEGRAPSNNKKQNFSMMEKKNISESMEITKFENSFRKINELLLVFKYMRLGTLKRFICNNCSLLSRIYWKGLIFQEAKSHVYIKKSILHQRCASNLTRGKKNKERRRSTSAIRVCVFLWVGSIRCTHNDTQQIKRRRFWWDTGNNLRSNCDLHAKKKIKWAKQMR